MKDYSKENRDNARKSKIDFNSAKSELDMLFEDVRNYRTSSYYRELLEFCSRFKQLAPFNAMMVKIQRPGCQYLLTSRQWGKEWRRRVKPNARPVVILSFQPVSYLFDLSDTEPIDGDLSGDEKILEAIKKQYDTKQEVEKKDLDILINNLPSLGIAYTDGFRAGAGYAARIELLANPMEIAVPINKKDSIKYNAHYLISVNETLSLGARYASIMHELGHFFCRHLIPPYGTDWWNVRRLSHADKEFEAESVAWLVCERLNIDNPSENYLAGYQAEMIPDNVSVDHIFKAHNEIWKLLFEQQYAKKSFLYKIDESFKKKVDQSGKPASISGQMTLFDYMD